MASTAAPKWLEFSTHASLRHRLVLSTLTGAPLKITNIRASSLSPGLTPSEISLLRLLDSLSNGAFFEISMTGTSFRYKPGILTGNAGSPITHVLPANGDRGVAYYLEVLALLAPFSKAAFSVTFTGGVTTAAVPATGDTSVDTFRTSTLPALARFGPPRNIEVRIIARSCGFPGAGEVAFVHAAQTLRPATLHLTAPGRVKKIRGVAYAVGVSAANNARMIEAARGVLNRFLPDVYVFSDVARAQIVSADYGKEGAPARHPQGRTKKVGVGFGLCLVAETGTACTYAADAVAAPAEAAEDVGRRAAWMLLEEVAVGGCVGRHVLPATLALMMMGVEGDVGRVVVGRGAVDAGLVSTLRDLKSAFGREVGVREDGNGNGDLLFAVVGRGIGNLARVVK
ncbi:RNA 3'-terminal phosphate cyclase/enolpyruvate transferase [Geopyxis carbonaria]|nr:RNA 3'-terminal phosphate cyclase/enolpyruvate transferase [Geopyxis carbonaria]